MRVGLRIGTAALLLAAAAAAATAGDETPETLVSRLPFDHSGALSPQRENGQHLEAQIARLGDSAIDALAASKVIRVDDQKAIAHGRS